MFIVTNFDFYSAIPSEPQDNLAVSAAKMAIHNFEWSYTLLLFNSSVLTGVDLFLKLYKKTLIVGKGRFYPPFAQETKQYILFGTDIVDIVQMLDWMSLHEFDNSGKYIVTCQSRDCDENNAVDIFWKRKITNIVFTKITANGEVIGYTYYYPDENCHISKPLQANVCGSDNSSCYGIFPKKIKNLQCCPITVSTFTQIPYMYMTETKPSGADGDLLFLIAEELNSSVKLIIPRIGDGWGKREPNGTWSGSLADLLDDAADISMTSAPITLSRYYTFQISVSYYSINLVWVTRPAEAKPASLRLFYPFETVSQIVLGISFIFVGLCAWFFNSKYWPFHGAKSGERKTKDGVFFYSWMICMGLPSTKLPKKPIFMYITLIWIWYCFLIRTFYQVSLISSLQGDFYYDELDTIEEAYYENYSFGGGLALREYFIDYPMIYDNWKPVNTTDIVPTLIKLPEKFVLAMNLDTAKTVIKKHGLFVRILPQTFVSSPAVIFFKKFSPLANSVDIILLRLAETGFIEKIYKQYASKSEPREDIQTPITLEEYTGCYVILFIGWIVSFGLFILEICYGKLQKIKCSLYSIPLT